MDALSDPKPASSTLHSLRRRLRSALTQCTDRLLPRIAHLIPPCHNRGRPPEPLTAPPIPLKPSIHQRFPYPTMKGNTTKSASDSSVLVLTLKPPALSSVKLNARPSANVAVLSHHYALKAFTSASATAHAPVLAPFELPDQKERVKALETARTEYASVVARLRISRALRARISPASHYTLAPGDAVYVYRKRKGQFIVPVLVVRVSDKEVYVKSNGKLVHFNISQVVPSSIFTDDHALDALQRQLQAFQSNTLVPGHTPPKLRGQPAQGILITEIIPYGDPRNDDPVLLTAKRKELQGLLKRGTYKVMCKEELPTDANIIGGRFILCQKRRDKHSIKYKASFIAQWHVDKEKGSIVHHATTLQHTSIRMILALAAIFGFQLWSTDITQAYLQSASDLMPDIHIRSSKEFELVLNQL
ncbi:hypothetical protein BWQ96_10002 [Gracilariopsis chorda]|uniref:Reverse transcriptase Ty1/copia-type domain-containing protein n=1 Tax=Gracilariopsis chorda TaxID=448386 RepID=A0A2V3IDZ0_9FLOR|nr:hypothetical protein BWQ96_10002 [Gracilariopsis chorda]|eukprot:PXF40296.1 hypothetical protein BWQ96_10002 [Gracilariopsis chorda]